MYYFLYFIIIISLGFGADYYQPVLHSRSIYPGGSETFNFPDDGTLRLVGIMVQFPIEVPDNPKTSGDGQFLYQSHNEYINFYNTDASRCDGFLLDPPPHDSLYFVKQLEAVGKYYETISNSTLIATSEIIINPDSSNGYFTVSNDMEYYAKADTLLAKFFAEALDSASMYIDTYLSRESLTPDKVVFIVFHAGLGQDFSYPSLDPTIYDLKSAYIELSMFKDKDTNLEVINPAIISGTAVYTGILLPETQNIIYYDVVEDIFGNPDYGTSDLCDFQYGLTGIFAYWLGYELGLPPMSNTDTGDPGVGLFGLMDYGYNNGRDVIPAPPTPWTRIKAGWSEVKTINYSNNRDSILITPYSLAEDTILQIDISEDEYFLIENRYNQIIPGYDIEYLRLLLWDNYLCENCDLNCSGLDVKEIIDSILVIEDCVANHQLPNEGFHYFDMIDSLIKIDSPLVPQIIDGGYANNIFSGFANYDYGLPGSGILIWHIKEPDEGLYSLGINNDKYNRHVEIEEADGAVDIGFESYAFFGRDNPTSGTRWDMWFKGSEAYERVNGYDSVLFNNWSIPNTRTTDGAVSFISIEILSEISDSMYIKITFDDGIDIIHLTDEPARYLGNSYIDEDSGSIYYSQENKIYKYYSIENSTDSILLSVDDYEESEDFDQTDSLIYYYRVQNNDQIVLTSNSHSCFDIDGEYQLECSIPEGYIEKYDESISVDTLFYLSYMSPGFPISLGDIDSDGLDEILYIKDNSLFAYNANNTRVNGFPVDGYFSGIPLIANILSIEDNKPEIICRENDDIIIISNGGERIRQLSSFDSDQPLAMVPYWDGNKMALIDGARLFLFDLDMKRSYWLNPRSHPSGFPQPISTSLHSSSPDENFGRQKAYNYPNPITDGRTTFRFFVANDVGNIQVRIYDAAGFLVKENLELIDPIVNEFNEIEWKNIEVNAGLYLAEIKQDSGKSELVKLVVIR